MDFQQDHLSEAVLKYNLKANHNNPANGKQKIKAVLKYNLKANHNSAAEVVDIPKAVLKYNLKANHNYHYVRKNVYLLY